MNIRINHINRRLAALALAGTISFTLVGCSAKELSSSIGTYDVLDTNSDAQNSDGLRKGIKQVLPVDGENFKLVIEYYCDDIEWRITSNKKLYMSIYTEGLVGNNVYIDTIHMDTCIVAPYNAYFDGIKQDTLDDHIHNSLMIGFPISDNNSYFGINSIEGQNSEFIEGYTNGYNGYSNGEISSKRHLESDFLENGVCANKIDGVIGLLIENPTTGEIRGVDVDTTLIVKVNNKITFEENGKYVTYQYDEYGNKTKVSTTDIRPSDKKSNKITRKIVKRYPNK